jgi:hypothetical protein
MNVNLCKLCIQQKRNTITALRECLDHGSWKRVDRRSSDVHQYWYHGHDRSAGPICNDCQPRMPNHCRYDTYICRPIPSPGLFFGIYYDIRISLPEHSISEYHTVGMLITHSRISQLLRSGPIKDGRGDRRWNEHPIPPPSSSLPVVSSSPSLSSSLSPSSLGPSLNVRSVSAPPCSALGYFDVDVGLV